MKIIENRNLNLISGGHPVVWLVIAVASRFTANAAVRHVASSAAIAGTTYDMAKTLGEDRKPVLPRRD